LFVIADVLIVGSLLVVVAEESCFSAIPIASWWKRADTTSCTRTTSRILQLHIKNVSVRVYRTAIIRASLLYQTIVVTVST